MEWLYNEQFNIVIGNGKGYGLDYVGNICNLDITRWDLNSLDFERTTKQIAFDKMVKHFEVELEMKEFKQARLLEETKNENIRILIQLKNSIKEVI